MAQLVKEAGFPPGVVNVVPGFVTIIIIIITIIIINIINLIIIKNLII